MSGLDLWQLVTISISISSPHLKTKPLQTWLVFISHEAIEHEYEMPWGNWTCSATVHVKPSTQFLRWAAPKLLWLALAYFDGNLMSQTSGSKYIGIGFISFLNKFWWRLLFLCKGVSHVSSEFCIQCVGGKNQHHQTSKNAKLLRALTVIPDSWPHGEIFGLCFCCHWGQVMQSEIQVGW